jgi:hypothetical protein
MEERSGTAWRSGRAVLAGILLLAVGTRLYHIDAPLLDQLYTKQIFSANKARNIAGPPLDLLCHDLDFLDDSGNRTQLVEEVPAYIGIVGTAYRLLGEHEWLGRAWNILACLLALVAFKDLVEREFNRSVAVVATLIFAMSPLFIFYGRAVMPDPSMLAAMLVAACCYRRFLDGGGRGFWIGALLAGALAGLFKYYGLIVLLPLAEMAWRHGGRRACFRWPFVAMAVAMVLPVAVWMAAIFVHMPNPARGSTYFIFQYPELLAQGTLYKRLFERFFWKDVGPVASALVAIGVWAALTRRARVRPILGWTIMGLVFYFLLGPKLDRHDYYELMMLPAAALWAALGWHVLWGAARDDTGPVWRRAWAGATVLALLIVVQCPLVMGSKFRLEAGEMTVAQHLRERCPPSARVVVWAPQWQHPILHYCGREGWMVRNETLDPDWRAMLAQYRFLGAQYVAVFFCPLDAPETRASYSPLTTALPVVEHQAGIISRKGNTSEFYILALPPHSERAGELQVSHFEE